MIPNPAEAESSRPRTAIGIPGLDEILNGGLPASHLHLVEGSSGTGKTTLALQFLLHGVAKGERCLFVTLSESRRELEAVAKSHGWSIDDLEILDLTAQTPADFDEDYTIFHPAEVELQQTMQTVLATIDKLNPARAVFDSISEMRLLAREPLRFRRQILAIKNFFASRDTTVLLLDDKQYPEADLQIHSLMHAVLVLEQTAPDYGAERRRLQIMKVRGSQFRGGYHDFRIETGGLAVFPRILHTDKPTPATDQMLSSGNARIDQLLGGGLTHGTSLLITGPAGTGKSVLCTQYAHSATKDGDRVLFCLFDERMSTFRMRARTLGMDVDQAIDNGQMRLLQIEPTSLSPGEFASKVVRAVSDGGISLVIIDSINGYMQSMPEARLLPMQVHDLLSFLANKNVTCVMTLVQHGIFGHPVDEPAEISYLADAVVLMRYFEFQGSVRQAISVVKRRSGNHEKTIREYMVAEMGLKVGDPLSDFQGVLSGVPTYTGSLTPLMIDSETETDRR